MEKLPTIILPGAEVPSSSPRAGGCSVTSLSSRSNHESAHCMNALLYLFPCMQHASLMLVRCMWVIRPTFLYAACHFDFSTFHGSDVEGLVAATLRVGLFFLVLHIGAI